MINNENGNNNVKTEEKEKRKKTFVIPKLYFVLCKDSNNLDFNEEQAKSFVSKQLSRNTFYQLNLSSTFY